MDEQLKSKWLTGEPEYFDDSEKRKLPMAGKRNVLITSALPYVNNVPHLGNIIGSVLSADVFSRYCRMRGYQSLYVCGTDEYGTATEMKALQEGVSPKEICDKYHRLHREIYDWFQIDFEVFGRTSTSHQTEITQEMFMRVHANGFTSTAELKQLHCGKCNKFLADRFVFGTCPHCGYGDARGDQCDKCGRLLDGVELIDPKCHLCSNRPTVKESRHIFLNLDQLAPEVEEYVEGVINDEANRWSANAAAIVRAWMKMGLERRCITRDLKWGIPVPLDGFESKVFYVWFDAPIGYVSITKSLLGEDWRKWWKNPKEVELFQFLGKDNVAFHGIIFPAVQLATRDDYTKVRSLCATEYLNYEDQKFSKSRGVGVFGDAVSTTGIPSDVWRFYLIYMRPEGQDTAFSWDDFMLKVNSELNNNLGNFVNRALSFLAKSFDAIVPEVELTQVELELFGEVDKELAEWTKLMEGVHLSRALQKILAISAHGNKYMQDNAPWALVKGDEQQRARAGTVIGVSANLAVLISVLLYPFMPSASRRIREQCGIKRPLSLRFVQFLKPGHKIGEVTALFSRLDPAKIAQWKKDFGCSTAVAAPSCQ